MSTRTPPLQSRSQFGRSWGNFASATALPNASGAPLAAPFFSILEVGDTAYSVAEGATYTCTSVGTVGGGNAVWSPGNPGLAPLTSSYRAVIPQGSGFSGSTVIGLAPLSAIAGATTRTTLPASAVFLERQIRNAVQSATVVNSVAGRFTRRTFSLPPGSRFQCVVGFLGSGIANMRAVVGLADSGSSLWSSATEPSAAGQPAGVWIGFDSGDANLQVMHKQTGIAAVKIDLGAAFARAANMTVRFELVTSAGRADYRVTRLDAAGVASGTILTDLPADTALLSWYWQCSNTTASTVAAIDTVDFKAQTDIA